MLAGLAASGHSNQPVTSGKRDRPPGPAGLDLSRNALIEPRDEGERDRPPGPAGLDLS